MARTDTDMKRSWLVQRLSPPNDGDGRFSEAINAFSFGGGLRNGGLSDEAMALVKGIFSFDYMGAAEFEWGAVPEAFQKVAGYAPKLTAFTFTIPYDEVGVGFSDDPSVKGEATIYVISHLDHRVEVEERIRSWAATPMNDLKETTRLTSALRPQNEWHREYAGWLELDNGFFFFVNRDMWEATAALFGVKTP